MRVKYIESIRYQVWQRVKSKKSDIVLRADMSDLADDRQISRALNALVADGKLAKLGYGVYVRLKYSELVNQAYLPDGLVSLAREALTRLGIPWEISESERAYNAGQTQQVPANPPTKLLGRFRRTLSYKGIKCRFE